MRTILSVSIPEDMAMELDRSAKETGRTRFLPVGREVRRIAEDGPGQGQKARLCHRRGRVQGHLLRAVFDTNVLVSAFAADGLCARLLVRANRGDFHLVVSPGILGELAGALDKKVGLSPREAREALRLIREVADVVDPSRRNIRVGGVCRDETDHAILEAALASRADFLVTGDRELLALEIFRKTRILSPREFELLFE